MPLDTQAGKGEGYPDQGRPQDRRSIEAKKKKAKRFWRKQKKRFWIFSEAVFRAGNALKVAVDGFKEAHWESKSNRSPSR